VREDTVRSAAILREARLRAGYSQDELARVSGKDRTVIARYEQGIVAPSLDTLVQLLRACGFDIPLELVPYDPGPDETRSALQMLPPVVRLDRMLERRRTPEEDRLLELPRERLREARRAEEERERMRQEVRRRLEERGGPPVEDEQALEERRRRLEDAHRRKEDKDEQRRRAWEERRGKEGD
jgi:transcriptional regulator with XRE-family HTH domain